MRSHEQFHRDLSEGGHRLLVGGPLEPSDQATSMRPDGHGEVLITDGPFTESVEQIVGFYHSHPGAAAVPSPTDLTHMRLWPETVWLIVPVFGSECRAPRVWCIDTPEAEAAREIGLRLLPLPERQLASCPE